MSKAPFWKKALGTFVEFEEKPQVQVEEVTPNQEQVQPTPVDLNNDPQAVQDIEKVERTFALISSLPLDQVPPAAASKIVTQTLQFSGMDPQELAATFNRVKDLLSNRIKAEDTTIRERLAENSARIAKFNEAINIENENCQGEVAARTQMITETNAKLGELDKVISFFQVTNKPQ